MFEMKSFEDLNKKDIFTSIKNKDIQSVENYINSGYDLNVRDRYGYTPLNFAAHENNIKIIKLLLNAGVDNVDEVNGWGDTALSKAVGNDNSEMVELLLNAGADINKEDKIGCTVLHDAASNLYFDMAKLLINNNATLDKQDQYGYTPLINTITTIITDDELSRMKIINLLIHSGANVNIQDFDEGNTALHFAVHDDQYENAKALLNAGADPNIKNDYGTGRTSLIIAARQDNLKMVELLLNHQSDVSILDDSNKSFYDYLCDKNKQYLLDKYPTVVYKIS